MSAPAPDLSERYGVRARRRGPLLVVVAALVLVAGAWLVWAISGHSRPEVQSELVSFHVHDPHAVIATFTVVRRGPDVHASCLLRAIADDHAVVGEVSVPVTSGATSRRVRATVRTERAATTLDLIGCESPGQSGRR